MTAICVDALKTIASFIGDAYTLFKYMAAVQIVPYEVYCPLTYKSGIIPSWAKNINMHVTFQYGWDESQCSRFYMLTADANDQYTKNVEDFYMIHGGELNGFSAPGGETSQDDFYVKNVLKYRWIVLYSCLYEVCDNWEVFGYRTFETRKEAVRQALKFRYTSYLPFNNNSSGLPGIPELSVPRIFNDPDIDGDDSEQFYCTDVSALEDEDYSQGFTAAVLDLHALINNSETDVTKFPHALTITGHGWVEAPNDPDVVSFMIE